jgi:hypothetical protein
MTPHQGDQQAAEGEPAVLLVELRADEWHDHGVPEPGPDEEADRGHGGRLLAGLRFLTEDEADHAHGPTNRHGGGDERLHREERELGRGTRDPVLDLGPGHRGDKASKVVHGQALTWGTREPAPGLRTASGVDGDGGPPGVQVVVGGFI